MQGEAALAVLGECLTLIAILTLVHLQAPEAVIALVAVRALPWTIRQRQHGLAVDVVIPTAGPRDVRR